MATWTVKAFTGSDPIEKAFESKDDANDYYYSYVDQGCPAYLYQNGEMINSYDPAYDEYCQRTALSSCCVYCGGMAIGGYCYASPDGNHVINS